jgi:hypothetical protein
MSEVVDFSTTSPAQADPPVRPVTLADRIRADLAARRRKVVEVVHPDAPAWRAFFRLPSDRTEVADLTRRAEQASKRKQAYFLDAAILAKFNESLEFEGEPLLDDAGDPLTFRSDTLFELLGGAASASDAVRKVYGSDGIVSAVTEQLMKAAGYDTADEVQIDAEDDDADPTPAG